MRRATCARRRPSQLLDALREVLGHRHHEPLLSSASACCGVSVSFRLSTCSDGSAQSSAAMNGCGFERTTKR